MISPAAGQDLASLYHTHHTRLAELARHILGNRADAEDLVADLFCHMATTGRRPDVGAGAAAYLTRATINNACTMLRSRKATARAHARLAADCHEPVSCDPATLVLDQELRRRVVGSLSHLPPRQFQVTVLEFWAGLSQTRIAGELGISCGAVKSHAFRARAALRVLLGPDLHFAHAPISSRPVRCGVDAPGAYRPRALAPEMNEGSSCESTRS